MLKAKINFRFFWMGLVILKPFFTKNLLYWKYFSIQKNISKKKSQNECVIQYENS
jgi:hypothetical protein